MRRRERNNFTIHECSVALLMSVIYEIGSGRSPRNILKAYLSKAEMSLFFKLGAPANQQTTVFSHFVYCKARAKGLSESVCARLAKVTEDIRLDKRNIFEFVQSFVEFCAKREVNAISVQDIWDYLNCNKFVGNFSFKGRTLASTLNLVNAWHDELNRSAKILNNNRTVSAWQALHSRIEDLKIVYKAAYGIPVCWNMVDKNTARSIVVQQLTKYADLINEGRAMHNCVASYHQYCAQKYCYIFSLRIAGERMGTIEVRDKAVVQARGYCNSNLTGYSLQCLRKWMCKFKLEEAF